VALLFFDLNGTLLDPGAGSEAIQKAVRLAMIHTMAGEFRPLAELVHAVGGEVPDEMDPFPDVPGGLIRLRDAGHRLAVLTNSAAETATAHLERAGLLACFERVVSVEEVQAYKPDRRVYEHALRELDAPAGEAWLVAAHDWDVIGAHHAGLRTVFVERGGPQPLTVEPDLTVPSLDELDRLLT
jgi:HAD superfamily hydrolase (TIGR01509 family)